MKIFDICVITASTKQQADNFRALIDRRIRHGLYPREIDFKVYPDPPGGRVGSGGSTLVVLNNLLIEYGVKNPQAFFKEKRIVIIHAGGESRRLPCYSPEGKVFAPVPVNSSSIFPPVLLDIQLSFFLKYPWQKGEILITSGDVVINFDISYLSDKKGDICFFAKTAGFEQGSRHGVFQFGKDEHVVEDYFQKGSKEFIAEHASLEGTSGCALDMGLISLSPKAAYAFVEISNKTFKNGRSIMDETKNGRINFNLYLEFISACIRSISFEKYYDRVHSRSCLNKQTLQKLYNTFHPLSLHAIVVPGAYFIHPGAMQELPSAWSELMDRELKPFYGQHDEEVTVKKSHDCIMFNTIKSEFRDIGSKRIYVENVEDTCIKKASGDNIFVGLRSCLIDETVPEGIYIGQKNVNDSPIRVVYSIYDNFLPEEDIQKVTFCGVPVDDWLKDRELEHYDLWEENGKYDLLCARLFSEELSDDFLNGYWKKPENDQWTKTFRTVKRYSINDINSTENVIKQDSRRVNVRKEILRQSFRDGNGWRNISARDFFETFNSAEYLEGLTKFYNKTKDPLLKAYRESLLSTVIEVKKIKDEDPFIKVTPYNREPVSLKMGIKKDQIVWARSPVRLDLAGGWSDTPPHALRFGGKVVNFAADLNGQPPIQVFCRRTDEKHIRFHSIDLGKTETVKGFKELENYCDLSSPFALLKAALCLMGLTKAHSGNTKLEDFLLTLGSGLEITLLCAVPKGSGLGTSSILGATILAAIHRVFDLEYTMRGLFWKVLQLEQMLTTGGGWQDQIGGMLGGIKYIESNPGYEPEFLIQQLDNFLLKDKKMLGCFTLYYTGITRLAKNILQDVVKQANENTPAYIFTIKYIKQLAIDAREAILSRDIRQLSKVLSQSWESNKRIHLSTTNEEIENLLDETRDLYTGVKLLGAGGGGYALFISKDGQHAENLREFLYGKSISDKARIVDLSLNTEGCQVSVS